MSSIRDLLPEMLFFVWLPLIPFIVAERIWPLDSSPRFRDHGVNFLISVSTAYLALPIGIAAALWSAQLRQVLPWKPLSFTFHGIATIPVIGPALEVVAMILVPLLIHDTWFYWSHRLEHRVPLLWIWHQIHHSDERMSASTYMRDQFLQTGWRAVFSIFTLGLLVDLDLSDAAKAAFYSQVFLNGLSMFYHSAIRVELPWLDCILVTPQVHRIHHGVDPAYHNKNFADALPVFDILFGTYRRPGRGEFPITGLGREYPAPRSIWAAQFGPIIKVFSGRGRRT